MDLSIDDLKLSFHEIQVNYEYSELENIFAEKKDISLQSFLLYRLYTGYYLAIQENYSSYMNFRIGDFLLACKEKGDDFYLNFLHQYGDLKYSKFYLDDNSILKKKGFYYCSIDGQIEYFRAACESFTRNINQDLGNIKPEDLFIDGNPELCYINSLINNNKEKVRFYICVVEEKKLLTILEDVFIKKYKPGWSQQYKNSHVDS